MANKPVPTKDEHAEARPPLFATWSGWYALVLGTLAAVVILFTLLTRMYE